MPVRLDGVPETLLWTLHCRAVWAERRGALLHDPLAIKVRDVIDDPYSRFGHPIEGPSLRAMRFDDAIRRFLHDHPDGTVVSLGEGLGTGFWRVDNGRALPAVSGKAPDVKRLCADPTKGPCARRS